MISKSKRQHDSSPPSMRQQPVTEETVRKLPPSAKLVLKVLDTEGTHTQKGLAKQTRLPRRTVREATKQLIDRGLAYERPYFPGARQSLYQIIIDNSENR